MNKNLGAAGAVGFVMGFALGVLVVGGRPEPRAAASLTGFLILVLLALGTVGAGVALAPGWLKQQKRRAELDDAERQARVYNALSGEQLQRPGARRPAQQPGPSVYIVGGSGGGQAEPATVEDLVRLFGGGQ